MDHDTVRAGIVGCGANARSHGDAADGEERVRFVACCDIDPGAAADFAAEYGVDRTYTDHVEMVEAEDLDLVVLSTWPNLHEQQVLDCVDAGAPALLCEKSLATNAASAARMARAAAAAGAVLVEAFKHRHHPRTRRLQELVETGEVGDLSRIRAGFHGTIDDETNWRRDPERGGGVVYDFTCYCVNTLGAFTGAVPERVAAEWTRRDDGLVEELWGLLRYDDGLVAEVDSSQRTSGVQPLELHGDEALLSLDHAWNAHQEDITVRADGETRTLATPAADPFEAQLRHVCECLRADETPRFTVEESVRNLAVVDAMLESAATNSVTTPDVPDGF
jgi:predicted dehydrogenase